MKKRYLGNTDIQISEVAFGGVEIGMPYGIGVTDDADMLTEAEAILLLRSAREKGLNFFDTARMYGRSENIMGKAFHGIRQDVILATKCRHFRDSKGALPSNSELKRIISQSLKDSLAALKTDYVDLYMLHQADSEILENEMIIEEFLKLKNIGVVRAIGVSTYNVDDSHKTIEQGVWDAIQLPFNLMDQRQRAVFDTASEKGVGLIVRSVLMKGLLSTRGTGLHSALADIESHIKKYHSYLKGSETLPEMAMKFVLSFPEVSSVLVGIDREDYLIAALEAADGDYFSDEKIEDLKAFAYPDPVFLDLPHWEKMGWLT